MKCPEGWVHSLETRRAWEQWSIMLPDGTIVEVIRQYKNTPLPPFFGTDAVLDRYLVQHRGRNIATFPLDTPLEEVMARAIVEARLR